MRQPTAEHLRRTATFLLLGWAAALGLGYWWMLGRPVPLPDAPAQRIACVSYTPFRKPGETPMDPRAHVSPARIAHDLAILSRRFGCVRTYSQGLGMDAVPAIARRYGMHVLMGIWLARDPIANEKELRLGIATANANRDVVRAIVVGNEVLLRGELPPATLAGYIRRVRKATHLPVTYADVWAFWLHYAHSDGLLDAVSFVTIHVLPYWEDQPMPVGAAVAHVAAVYQQVRAALPGKRVMIGETGWPSAGRPRGGAEPSRVNEARYVRAFLVWAQRTGVPYNLIESFDQPWKRAQEGTVGGYWGLYDSDARPKFAWTGPVVEAPHWRRGWLAAALMALACVGAAAWRRRWRGGAGWTAAALAGIAAGSTLAAAARLMSYACGGVWEWMLAGAALAAALGTALYLARALATILANGRAAVPARTRFDFWPRRLTPPATYGTLRFGWLCVLAVYDLLLVADGRYRDFPIALFAVPAAGFLLRDLCCARASRWPSLEEWLLSAWLPASALIVVLRQLGENHSAWWWAGVNLLFVLPLWLGAWAPSVALQARQPQHANQ